MSVYIKTQNGATLLSSDSNSIISDAYNNTKSYSAGEYFIKDNTLYKVTTDLEEGVYDEDSIEATTVANELYSQSQSIRDMTATTIINVKSHDLLNTTYTFDPLFEYKKILIIAHVDSATAAITQLFTPEELSIIRGYIYPSLCIYVNSIGYARVTFNVALTQADVLLQNLNSNSEVCSTIKVIGFK